MKLIMTSLLNLKPLFFLLNPKKGVLKRVKKLQSLLLKLYLKKRVLLDLKSLWKKRAQKEKQKIMQTLI